MGETIIVFTCLVSFTLLLLVVLFYLGIIKCQADETARAEHTRQTGHTQFDMVIASSMLPTTVDSSFSGQIPVYTWECTECGQIIAGDMFRKSV